MLNLLNWGKPIRVNGKVYPNSQAAWEELKELSEDDIIIELNFVEKVPEVDPVQVEEVSEEVELKYIFNLPLWLARANKCLKTLRGDIIGESPKAIHVKAFGVFTADAKCRVCGRPLTNPESIKKGIGPICMEKVYGITPSTDDEADWDEMTMQAEEVLFDLWLPKNYISWTERLV